MTVCLRCVFATALVFGPLAAVGCDRDWSLADPPAAGDAAAQSDGDASPPHPATIDAAPAVPDADATVGDATIPDSRPDAGDSGEGDAPDDGDAAHEAEAGDSMADSEVSTTPDADANAGPDAGVCDPLGKFDPPVLLTALNTIDDEQSAVLTDNELTIYFARGNKRVQKDIYMATRAHQGDDFGPAQKVDGVSTPALDVGAAPSSDDLTMYIDTYFGGFRSVQMATRAQGGTFGTPTLVDELTSPSDEDGMPYLLTSGNVIYFSSSRNSHHFDIFRAEKAGGATFAAPAEPQGINDPLWFDGYPVVSDDELTMYFGTARLTHTYGTDIYAAHRAHRGDTFGAPVLVTELDSTAYINYPSWLSADGCRLYFTSSRTGGHGTDTGSPDDMTDIWVATRHP
jgi:hypothetical protein